MAVDYTFRLRPLNTPIDRVKLRQLTSGGEWMLTQEDLRTGYIVPTIEYIGLYHVYPNGAVYTGAVPSTTSIPLTRYMRTQSNANGQVNATIPENNTDYARLTNYRFYNYTPPKMYYPRVKSEQYAKGRFLRFFARKINADDIIEISPTAYASANEMPGIGRYLQDLAEFHK